MVIKEVDQRLDPTYTDYIIVSQEPVPPTAKERWEGLPHETTLITSVDSTVKQTYRLLS